MLLFILEVSTTVVRRNHPREYHIMWSARKQISWWIIKNFIPFLSGSQTLSTLLKVRFQLSFFLYLIIKLLECETTYEPEVIFKLGRVRIDLYQVTCLSVIHHIPDER